MPSILSPNFTVLIPARYVSTRLPGKMLADISGAPMVIRVAQRARASGALQVAVATDHLDIATAVRAHGFDALMTRVDHASGTDRLAEAAQQLGLAADAIVVNVQGDEPLIEPALIARVAQALDDHPEAAMATLAYPMSDAARFTNPNVVKVVLDRDGNALYFSRAPIPFPRDAMLQGASTVPTPHALHHVGLYAYRAQFLQRYATLAPSHLEQIEALEQLRALWHGYKIHVVVTDAAPAPGVDTAADLALVRGLFDRAYRSS